MTCVHCVLYDLSMRQTGSVRAVNLGARTLWPSTVFALSVKRCHIILEERVVTSPVSPAQLPFRRLHFFPVRVLSVRGPSSVPCVSRSTGPANRAPSFRGPSSVSRVSRFTGKTNHALSVRGPSSVSLCVPCSVRVQARSLVCPISLGKPIAPCLVAVQARSLCVSRALFGSKLGLLCVPFHWASQSRPVWSRSKLGLSCVPFHWASQSRPVWSRSKFGLSVCPVLCSSPGSVSCVPHFNGQANRALSGRGPSSVSPCVPFSVRVQARSLVCPISLGKPIAPCLVAVQARSLVCPVPLGKPIALSGRGPSSVSLCVPCSVRVQARSLVCPISLGKPIAQGLVAVQVRPL